MSTKRITVCGRIHLGPVCISGTPYSHHPTCMSCGEVLTKAERDTINHTWDTVRAMLAKYRAKEIKR